ncbi:MAG: protein kinase [Acidobacteriaceae bacterium]
MALLAGVRIGPYEIKSPLGAGGMGEVYRARDTRLDRTVAIKILPTRLSEDPEAKQRLDREARAISSLNHPNICTLHDVGHQDGIDYLVMECLEGETLALRLSKGPMPTEALLSCAREICRGLGKAHRSGVVHRDLKPANIMLTKTGVKLMDFGLAKAVRPGASPASGLTATQESPNGASLTTHGKIVGTLQYMSPEQLEGREVDARSDIFSLGAVLYEMATGKRAFEGKTNASVLAAVLTVNPPPITALQPVSPPALERIVRTCLAKDPEERYQDVHDIELELRWIAEGGTPGSVSASPRRKGRERLAWGVAAALALVGLAFGWYLHRPKTAEVLATSIEMPSGMTANGLDTSLAFSPDGRRLALTLTGANETTQIWIRSLDSITMQPLADTTGAQYPTWSPDGQSLAFFADHELKKINVASGVVEVLCAAEDGRGLAWGPDGQIVFAPTPYSGLFLVSAAGGQPVDLVHPRPGETYRLPQFLPDGDHVLFFHALSILTAGQQSEWLVLSLKTKQVKALNTPAPSGAQYVEPGYLIFVRDGNLMAEPFDAARLRVTGEAFPLVEEVWYNAFRFTGAYAMSGSGLLVYSREPGGGSEQLTWLGMDGRELGKVGAPINRSDWVALSPDDSHAIVTASGGRAGFRHLYEYDLRRNVISRFTFGDTAEEDSQVWSPDGKQVAFAVTVGAPRGIYVKAADGNTPERRVYASDEYALPTSWSPDGKLLAFDLQGRNRTIEILPMTGDAKPYPLHPGTQANEMGARFSPDGHWIVYQSNDSGRAEVYVERFPGPGGRWQVTQNGGSPAWLDKNHVAWHSVDLTVMAAPLIVTGTGLEIGTPQTLIGGRKYTTLAGSLAFSHDGKRILMPLPTVDPAIHPTLTLVENWQAAMKK